MNNQANKQPVKRESQVMDAFELQIVKDQVQAMLDGNPKKVEAFKTRILRMSLNDGLRTCTPESIITCGLQALTLNLPLDGGQGYIVNYGGKAQLDVGYKGWQIMAKRAGYSVLADVVYGCDDFSQDGFGFNRHINFKPDHESRRGFDDTWAKDNLVGVIVSIKEDETGTTTHSFVDAGTVHKIVGKSPSAGKTGKGGVLHSPHDNWAEQMFAAKAIKQVLSKFAIDLAEHTQIGEAMNIVNNTEILAQAEAKEPDFYPQERFDENYPKWKEIVQSGKKTGIAISAQLSNSYRLTEQQLEKVIGLRNFEPIEAEAQPEAAEDAK